VFAFSKQYKQKVVHPSIKRNHLFIFLRSFHDNFTFLFFDGIVKKNCNDTSEAHKRMFCLVFLLEIWEAENEAILNLVEQF